MTHLSKDIPYRNTSIAETQTKIDIDEMLKEAGAIARRWTDTPDSMKGVELPIVEFILPSQWEGVQRDFVIRVQTPLLCDHKRRNGRYGEMIATPNRNASMRLLYWYLKARLEGIRFGIEDVFDAFMPKIVNSLPNQEITTLSQTMRKHPEVISGILPTFEIKALPAATE